MALCRTRSGGMLMSIAAMSALLPERWKSELQAELLQRCHFPENASWLDKRTTGFHRDSMHLNL